MKRNKTYIPFDHTRSIGGPNTFMQNLRHFFDECGYTYQNTSLGARVIFFPIAFDLKVLKKIKHKGGKIIQRLDGVYYPSKHGPKYVELNKTIKDIYLHYSDCIIFQSIYSKRQCFAMFGPKKKGEYVVIINGADLNIFFPDYDITEINEEIRFITTGNFRNVDMIEPIVKALDLLKKDLSFKLVVAGPVKPELQKYLSRDYIIYVGTRNPEKIAEFLRKSHIFIYSHLNPPCPNSIIEAVSCGLPVVGFNSGAMSELLFFSKDLLAEVSKDLFQSYRSFDYHRLAVKIMFTVENFPECRKRSLENSKLYSFKECGRKYLALFKKFY